ncbi:MAG TPA: hypothetical protein EYN69_00665 [Flavobacteriales bacterium]|nr:hypothetical protein [Flavobacteriales bacterium]
MKKLLALLCLLGFLNGISLAQDSSNAEPAAPEIVPETDVPITTEDPVPAGSEVVPPAEEEPAAEEAPAEEPAAEEATDYSHIENTALRLQGDQLIIEYDIIGSVPFDMVWVEITTKDGSKIHAKALSGDIGPNIDAGKGKQIIWDMNKDNIDLQGQDVNVEVKGKVKKEKAPKEEKVKKVKAPKEEKAKKEKKEKAPKEAKAKKDKSDVDDGSKEKQFNKMDKIFLGIGAAFISVTIGIYPWGTY